MLVLLLPPAANSSWGREGGGLPWVFCDNHKQQLLLCLINNIDFLAPGPHQNAHVTLAYFFVIKVSNIH